MKTNLRTKIAASILIMGLGLASAANAQNPLPPGSTIFNTADNTLETSLGSNTFLAFMSSPFVADNPSAFSGVLDSWVLGGNTDNSLGGLTFVYRLTNSANSADAIHRIAVNGYSGVTVEAAYLEDGSTTPSGDGIVAGGLKPSLADRGVAPGDNAAFSFLSGTVSGLTFDSLNPGEASRYLLLYTDASTFASNSIASVIDGSIANAATFAPMLSPVPEPETYALMLAGLGLMGFVGRRRAKKSFS
jgi:hypothetical protein